MFIIAAAQFPAFAPRAWNEVEDRLSDWVADAAAHGARLLVFPEYASMSLAHLFAPAVQADLHLQIAAMQDLRESYLELHRRLAQAHAVHLLAGSFPWRLDGGEYRNRAWLFAPDAGSDFQDKRLMTRFERERWGIAGGGELKVFATALGRIAVNVCYDVEFPLLARAQAEAGAELILAPSCTDTLGGYNRVKIGAQARALENQCYVAVAPLVGTAPWSPAIDINLGAAAVFGPPDLAFPDDGVVAQGEMNAPAWVYAEIDAGRVRRVRGEGQVLNHRHWGEQLDADQRAVLPPVDTVSLERDPSMWSHDASIETSATPAQIWKLFSDVSGWKKWNAGIAHIEIHGPFARGTRFSMQPPGAAAFISTLVDVKENESFTDETLIEGTRVLVHHRITRLAAGNARVTYRTEIGGPDAAEFGARITGDFPDVLNALKRLCGEFPMTALKRRSFSRRFGRGQGGSWWPGLRSARSTRILSSPLSPAPAGRGSARGTGASGSRLSVRR